MLTCSLTCRFVPGTMDRVFVVSRLGRGTVSLATVENVLGRPALESLYLRGRYALVNDEDSIWYTLVCLGVNLTPDESTPVVAERTPLVPDLRHHAQLPADLDARTPTTV